MTYDPYPWTLNEKVTAAKLAHMETQATEGLAYLAASHHDGRYYTSSEYAARYQQGNSPSGGDADTLQGKHSYELPGMLNLAGLIEFWESAAPPASYALCNGQNGTPNPQGRFLVCAGGGYSPGDTGGSATQYPAGSVVVAAHALTVDEMPYHTHPYYDSAPRGGSFMSNNLTGEIPNSITSRGPLTTDYQGGGVAHPHSGEDLLMGIYDNRPAYIVLWPIIHT